MVAVTRSAIIESRHLVRYALADARGRVIDAGGDIDAPTYMRSAAKPLISAAIVAGGAADRFGLDDRELAVITGSHSGEPFHVAAVRAILSKIGLTEEALACGAHLPLHAPSAQAILVAGQAALPVHNNCSGKHAGILALAMHRGAGPKNYLSAEHPAQAEILDACAQLLQVPRASLIVGVDGCGIPVIAVPLVVAARFFAKLGEPDGFAPPWNRALERVRRAMTAHPQYVAGSGRFDTELMRAAGPDVACKGGAEGYHAVSAAAQKLGLCAKVADGNPRALAPLVLSRLHRFGALSESQLGALDAYRRPQVTNHAGKVVGEIIAS